MLVIVLMVFAFAAGFMVRPYMLPDIIMTLSDYRKKPYYRLETPLTAATLF
jgi:hypothetical protein